MGRANGVYCTIHTDKGDFDTAPPHRTDYDGAMMTMYLRVVACPFSGQSDTLALHWGASVVELGVAPFAFNLGDGLTVIQPVSVDELTAGVPTAVKP